MSVKAGDVMKEIKSLKDRLSRQRPDGWEELPDLALYMDQLISYMPRQLIPLDEGDALTAAMVNNYIKAGLLPRAEGKRYGRKHLACLTAICALKPVLSMKELAALLNAVDNQHVVAEDWYAFFLSKLDESMNTVAASLDENAGEADLPALALRLALDSYANKLACQRVLTLLEKQSKAVVPPAPEKKKKPKSAAPPAGERKKKKKEGKED